MATPPLFVAGQVLTAAQMNQIGFFEIGSFALAATTNVNNVFTSDYKNYRLVIATTTCTSADITMRLRVGGADNTTSNYNNARNQSLYNTTAPTSVGAAGVNAFSIGRTDSGDPGGGISIDVYNPQTALRTWFTGQSVDAQIFMNVGGYFDLTTQFDGFTLFGSATWTGTVSVYGYRD
jgi:hypothetical protein